MVRIKYNGVGTHLSNVIPLPTTANGAAFSSPPLYSISRNLGGSSEPLATLKYEPIFIDSAHALSLSKEITVQTNDIELKWKDD